MGSVYLGRDLSSGRLVAIKRLQPDLVANDPEMVERFAREGEALRQLNHPNIVKVLDTIHENGQHYIVMEYVGGGSLRQLMDVEGQLSLQLVLSLGLEIADALSRAHHLNIIHRDIKPANVLLAEDKTPHLTDFGIALMGDQSRITQAGALAGTYAYLCPEAWEGRALDGRADIWSFGVLLYEMLAGRHPFEAETLAATFAAILNKEPAPLLEFRPDVPAHLAELIHGMLRKDPEQRISGVRLVGATLEAIEKGDATPGVTGQASRFATPALAARKAPSNLPHQGTPFIGRRAELIEIASRLSDPSCRLLTLVGPGGIGKTRLALQAAASERANYRHGVYLVQLAPLSSPESIVPTIAEAIGFSFYRTEDPDRIGPSPRQQLLDHLREKEMLLLLDNYEHLLQRADLAADILAQAPQAKLLATSRERLNILGEWVMPVRGLAYPTHESPDVPGTGITGYSSVQLYVQRARQMGGTIELDQSTEEAIIRICQLVDGAPLAIELAASWLQTLSAAEIAAEIERSYAFLETTLRDMPERHRSLRVVFENSWNLLDRKGQQFLASLSVFRGGFDREAAMVVAANGDRNLTLAQLAALVGKSLLKHDPSGRYELHQLLAQFAAEKLLSLDSNSEGDSVPLTNEKHSDYYCSWLGRREEALRAKREKEAIRAVERDIENIREAWRWAARHGKVVNIATALIGLASFLGIQNWQQEGADLLGYAHDRLLGSAAVHEPLLMARLNLWRAGFIGALGKIDAAAEMLEASLERFRELASPADEAAALDGLGQVAAARGFLVKAADLHKRSLSLYRQINDEAGAAAQIVRLGRIANERGLYEESRALLNEALEMRRRLGDLPGVAGVLDTLGFNAYRLGDGPSAAGYADEAILINEAIGHRAGVANAMRLKGMVASLQGDYSQALTHYHQALEIRREIGNRGAVGGSYTQLSHVALLTGDYAAAREYALKCLEIAEEINNQWSAIYALNNLGLAQVRLGELEAGRQSLGRALGIARDMNARPLALEILVGFAELAVSQGDRDHALALLCLVRDHPALIHETWQLATPLYHQLLAARGLDPETAAKPCLAVERLTLESAVEALL
jgi:predicted ATPase